MIQTSSRRCPLYLMVIGSLCVWCKIPKPTIRCSLVRSQSSQRHNHGIVLLTQAPLRMRRTSPILPQLEVQVPVLAISLTAGQLLCPVAPSWSTAILIQRSGDGQMRRRISLRNSSIITRPMHLNLWVILQTVHVARQQLVTQSLAHLAPRQTLTPHLGNCPFLLDPHNLRPICLGGHLNILVASRVPTVAQMVHPNGSPLMHPRHANQPIIHHSRAFIPSLKTTDLDRGITNQDLHIVICTIITRRLRNLHQQIVGWLLLQFHQSTLRRPLVVLLTQIITLTLIGIQHGKHLTSRIPRRTSRMYPHCLIADMIINRSHSAV
jgi:hypothetical protein